jgi:phosphatidylcholine synthase
MNDSLPPSLPPPTLPRRACAWGVHLFTASGAVWGILSILAIQHHQYKLLFLWVALAMFVDGFDGILARLAHTKVYAAELDGALLDNIIDYLNYVIVAALLVMEAKLVPAGWGLPVACLMALSSAYQFSQAEAKTDSRTQEFYFKGFPDYWNFLALYLLLLKLNPWLNLLILLACVVLVFVPIKFIYPSRTRFYRGTIIVLMLIWGLSGAAMLVLYPRIPPWLTLFNLVLAGVYVIASLAATLRRPLRAA